MADSGAKNVCSAHEIIGKRARNSLVLNHGTVFRCAPMGSKNSEQDCVRSFDLTCSLHRYFSHGDAAIMEGWRSDSADRITHQFQTAFPLEYAAHFPWYLCVTEQVVCWANAPTVGQGVAGFAKVANLQDRKRPSREPNDVRARLMELDPAHFSGRTMENDKSRRSILVQSCRKASSRLEEQWKTTFVFRKGYGSDTVGYLQKITRANDL